MFSFRPIPLLSNPHVQTILGNLLAGRRRTGRGLRRVVPLPDGDAIVLHETSPRFRAGGEPASQVASTPVALLVHGLGGSHRSGYIERVTQRLNDLGWRVLRMDLRGAGAGVRFARRIYNAACSTDVRVAVEHIMAVFPHSPIAVAGFSLGGNIVLKYAGELSASAPPALFAVAAVAPPIDLLRCSDLMGQQPFYDAFYVRHLVNQVAEHQRHFPELPRVDFPRRMVLREFDELYTAPRWGYANADDYYRKASSFPWIDAIRVPTFILTARDDPFVAVEPFELLPSREALEVHISPYGGHMGFLGPDGAGGIRWAETQVIQWLTRRLAGPATLSPAIPPCR